MLIKEKLDNLHYSFREINGYNKDINIVISPREPGKTSNMWMDIFSNWLKTGEPWFILVRRHVEITEEYIDSIIQPNINKFFDDEVVAHFKKGDLTTGVCDVSITTKDISKPKLFFRIVSLNLTKKQLKQQLIMGAKGMFIDEYIIDPTSGEKYLKNEYSKIQEAYTTWRRGAPEGKKFKIYVCGNPYSLYNPLFMGLGVDITKLKRDSFYVDDNFVIHWAILKPELRAYLLEQNPFYKFDEDYSNYALDGKAINDSNIKLGKMPMNYSLKWIFRANKKYISVYQNKYIDNLCDMYFCKFEDTIGSRRDVYCYDFNELVDRCAIISREDKEKFARFKRALQRNLVTFENIAVYYIIIEIYNFI